MTSGPAVGRTPSPYPDGSRVLHIGLPKTGTSTVQTALHEQRAALAEHGVVYLGFRRHSYDAAAAALDRSRPWSHEDGHREWARLARRMRTSEARCTVFSSEVLSGAHRRRVRSIVEQLGGDVQVLVTLRAFADVVASNWQQGLRNQSTLTLAQWVEDALAKPPRTAKAQAFQRRFDLGRYLRDWGSVVGEEALTFVIPDPTDRRSLLVTLEGLLGLPEETISTTRPANRSLPYPEAEFLRQVALASEAEECDHETWMRTAGSGWAKARIRTLRTPLQPYPIRVPRWAAERANEVSRPWVEALCASGATIVGDPAHLLVDPADYPADLAVPETVRIDAAAELAAVLYSSAQRLLPATGEGELPSSEPSTPVLAQVPARELATHLGRRALRRLARR